MLSMAALGPWGPVVSGVWSFATSRLGNVILAASIAYGVAHFREEWAWEASVAAHDAQLRAEHAAEVAREANAAQEIGAAAVARAEDDDVLVGNLNDQIEQLKRKERQNVPIVSKGQTAPSLPCDLDDARVDRVRRFDAASHRAPAPSRRSSELR